MPENIWMQRAIDIAFENSKTGGLAVGAVIINNCGLVSEAVTTIRKENDPTCHAEMNAIRKAVKNTGKRALNDCIIYSTFEPCPMCTGAIIWSGIQSIVYGASKNDQNATYTNPFSISCQELILMSSIQVNIFPEFMREQCIPLLSLSLSIKNSGKIQY